MDIEAPHHDLEAAPFIQDGDGAFAKFIAEDRAAECGGQAIHGHAFPALRRDLGGEPGAANRLLPMKTWPPCWTSNQLFPEAISAALVGEAGNSMVTSECTMVSPHLTQRATAPGAPAASPRLRSHRPTGPGPGCTRCRIYVLPLGPRQSR